MSYLILAMVAASCLTSCAESDELPPPSPSISYASVPTYSLTYEELYVIDALKSQYTELKASLQ